MRIRSRTAVAVLSLATVLVASPAGASSDDSDPKDVAPASPVVPSTGPPPGGFASWGDLMQEQERLTAAADRILNASQNGFAGIEVSAEDRALRVHWRGRPPAPVREVLNSLRGEVQVHLHNARHSQAQLNAEAQRVARVSGVTAVSPTVDGSGLSVSVSTAEAVGRARAAAVAPIVEHDIARPIPLSRLNDWAPYWGGARWDGCSTGFAISIGGNRKMLSAGHCSSNARLVYDGGGDFMGTVSGDNNSRDTLYINTYSGGRIYDGGVGTGEFSKPVVGASRSYVGHWLCTSGAYSGARCNIRVRATNQTIYAGYYIYGLVRAEQVNYTNAAGQGDSGGPVFSLASDTSKVIAKGTITGGDDATRVACTGVTNGRVCSWRIYYADVADSLARYGATIVTG